MRKDVDVPLTCACQSKVFFNIIENMLDNQGQNEASPQKKKRKFSNSQENSSSNQEICYIKVFKLLYNGHSSTVLFFLLPSFFFFFFLLHLGTAATFVLEQPSSQNLMVSFTASVSQRLEGIESKLQALDATCKALAQKLDSMVPCAKNSIQVPMVAGSPQGATQTWNKVRW